jgi:hypothetical protein
VGLAVVGRDPPARHLRICGDHGGVAFVNDDDVRPAIDQRAKKRLSDTIGVGVDDIPRKRHRTNRNTGAVEQPCFAR